MKIYLIHEYILNNDVIKDCQTNIKIGSFFENLIQEPNKSVRKNLLLNK